MKQKFRSLFYPKPVFSAFVLLSVCSITWAFGDPVLIGPEISITAPSSIRAVVGTTLAPLNFSTTNLVLGSATGFGLTLSTGSVGSINNLKQPDVSVVPGGIRTTSTPFTSISLLAGNTGTISSTPSIAGVLAGQTSTFGLSATNAAWNAPVTANASINVVANRLLTGSVTIDAGRHMAGLQSIGSITLNGGALNGTEGTNISINSGGYAQLANGLRLTSTTDFTFNGVNQTHDLQISYNRPTGAYTITNESLPGASGTAVNYTDASGGSHQEFGGAWKTSAEYGNVFGAKQVFTEQNRTDWKNLPSYDIAWQRPGTNGYSSNNYIYNREIAGTSQPSTPSTRYGTPATWELSRGEGSLINERINPLISGEVIQGSSLNLSGISFSITGTAVADRTIIGGTIDLGRRMMGASNVAVDRTDLINLSTYGSDNDRTRISLGDFSLTSTGVTAIHTGNSNFAAGSDTAQVQLTGNFTIDTSIAGRVTRYIDAGSSITGEGLAGEQKQSSLSLGYSWNNLQNNELIANNLLVIDSNSRTDTRDYNTLIFRKFDTDTHTNIGASGNLVQVNGAISTGLSNLGNRSITPTAEAGVAGQVLTGSVSFNTLYASVTTANYSVTNTGTATGPLTGGNIITVRDNGSGIYQNNLTIDNVSIAGGQNLDYKLIYGGGNSLLQHNESRTFTVDYIGNTAIPTSGQLGRVSRADLSIGLADHVNYNGIVDAVGTGRYVASYTGGNHLESRTYALETRFDAPPAATATSTVAVATNFANNGLSLNNTSGNTSTRFTQTTGFELIDSAPLTSSKTVQVEFVKIENASATVVAALEDNSVNSASRAGIYGGAAKPVFVSDIVNLSGLDHVMQVLQLSYDSTGYVDESGAQLLWQYNYTDTAGLQITWINSVLGNSNVTGLDLLAGSLTVSGNTSTSIQDYLTSMRFAGSYDEYLANQGSPNPILGAWGLDMDANKVWAVIDHNSSFAVSIPEPSLSFLVLFGLAGFAVRRARH